MTCRSKLVTPFRYKVSDKAGGATVIWAVHGEQPHAGAAMAHMEDN